MSELERLNRAKYVQLTTFRKSGEPVSTPVWAVSNGEELCVWSERESWKVKRVRNTPRVEVTACDLRGGKTHGRTVPGKARLLGDAETDQVRKLLGGKYGIVGFFSVVGSVIRGGKKRTIGIGISLEE